MSENEEVDKRLTADFILTKEQVDTVLVTIETRKQVIAVYEHEIAEQQKILDAAAYGVMCKLTEFTDVLGSGYEHDEDLLAEIQVYNYIRDFKADAANKYNQFMTERENDEVRCGFYDHRDGFCEVVRFPFSYLTRMDWLYRLEVELGVFRLKEAEKYSGRKKK